MPEYNYRARNFRGEVIAANIQGESKGEILLKLREKGYFITTISEIKRGNSISLPFFTAGSVSSAEVCIFARQFATMIGSGVPLVRCLSILQTQCENSYFKKIILQIKTDVESGLTFSSALEKHPKIFNNLFVNLVKAGEAGGILDQILIRLALYLESSEKLKAKVKGAMVYPVVVFSIAALVVLGLIMFVLPQFKEIFVGMGIELPLITRLLLDFSDFLQTFWWLVLMAAGLIPYALKFFFNSRQGARLFDTNILQVPFFGTMVKKVAVSKFTRTLGTLIQSGVPILQALEVTAQTAGNLIIAEAVDKTRVSIREGESIAGPLKESQVFPPMVVQMIAVGEETGELDKMLAKIADFYDSEVDTAVKGITSVIEPIIIVFLGVVIGGIVMAVFMPMIKIVNL
ncbi:type II secretion system F family protein [Candidatus Riflebacteria bacterium]